MKAPRIACALALLAFTVPLDLTAQQEMPVAQGDRVRVSRAGTVPPLICTFLALKADTLLLDVEDRVAPLELPLTLVNRVEVSRGRTSNIGRGALTGGLVGAVFGSIIGIGVWQGGSSDGFISFGPDAVAIGAGVLGGAGAVVGLLIGAATQSDRWEEVPLDKLRVGPSEVAGGGVRVSVTLRF